MQLTQATDYAFRAVQHLASEEHGNVVAAPVIAESEEIPLRFLLKIMRSLIGAGIIKSYRGVDGGFALAKPAGQITLLEVVEAIEGPVRISRCLMQPEYCTKNYTKICPVHHVLGDVQLLVTQKLGRVTFADLAGIKKGG
jgi:Rrf2 family protein